MTSRLNLILALALLLSCLWLIRSSNEARQLFVELEKAQAHERELELEYERLQLEKRAQATPLRVEKLAREKLKMFGNTPGVTHYVKGASAPAAAEVAP
ncbi:MAG: cell division protein FtsL [Aquabacterium sp.]